MLVGLPGPMNRNLAAAMAVITRIAIMAAVIADCAASTSRLAPHSRTGRAWMGFVSIHLSRSNAISSAEA